MEENAWLEEELQAEGTWSAEPGGWQPFYVQEAGGWMDTDSEAGRVTGPGVSQLLPCDPVRVGARGCGEVQPGGDTPLFIAENSVLYTEILARLLYFATSHPAMIGHLCQQAQSWFRACPHPMLVPLAGFLQPPGGRLRATLTGCHKGKCPHHHKNTSAHCVPGGPDARYLGLLSGAPLCQTGGPRYHWDLPLLSHD